MTARPIKLHPGSQEDAARLVSEMLGVTFVDVAEDPARQPRAPRHRAQRAPKTKR